MDALKRALEILDELAELFKRVDRLGEELSRLSEELSPEERMLLDRELERRMLEIGWGEFLLLVRAALSRREEA